MNSILSFRIIITVGLLLFLAIHFFYDPYRIVESIASSKEVLDLNAGAPDVRLADVSNAKPGILYRARARIAWDSVEAGIPAYKIARVIFASYDESGRWIPSPHGVCGVTGSGRDSFAAILPIPENTASSRMVFQQLGRAGHIRLERFSLEQVERKSLSPLFLRVLQVFWAGLAVWTLWRLRLLHRRGGIAVVLIAALIMVGMVLPRGVVKEVPSRVAAWVGPVEVPQPAVVAGEDKGQRSEDDSGIGVVVRDGRSYVANWMLSLDFNLLGHAGLFLLLGAASSICFVERQRRWHRVVRVFAGGVVFAVAAELLQVTELSRTVRISDIGVNIQGWLTGLLSIALLVRGLGKFEKEILGR